MLFKQDGWKTGTTSAIYDFFSKLIDLVNSYMVPIFPESVNENVLFLILVFYLTLLKSALYNRWFARCYSKIKKKETG